MTTYAVAPDVAWVSREELDGGTTPVAYVAALPDGPALVLEGPACLVWLAVVDGGTLAQLCASVADMTDEEPESVEADVTSMLDELLAAGVVRRG